MSALLLSTKLSIPPMRPNLVARPQLIQQLDAGLRLERTLTLISAMAGSGKTTLATAWLQHVDRPVGWLSLDQDDNDLVRFMAHLIAVLKQINSAIGQAAQGVLEAQPIPSVESLVTLLINDIATVANTFVLALDDFHVIQAPAIHALIECLLDHQPRQLHLVLLTREDPPLALPRLRARGQLTELRTADLRFRADEIARFLQQTHGLVLEAELIAALEARTEGWITGVQLAALALQGRDGAADYIHAFSGSHRYLIDYLAEDVLQRLPHDLCTFLHQTAILNRLTPPLCDAVAGRTDSALCLRQLEQANLFVIPLDDRREWYRYHHLFAEFLRSALEPEEGPLLHLRAAQWYQAHGFLEEAIDHALESNNQELATNLIIQAASQTIQDGRLTTLLRWLEAMPDAQVRTNADLAVYKGWSLWLIGQADAAASYAQSAETSLTSGTPTQTRGRLLGLRAFVTDPEAHNLHLLQEALDAIGDADPLFRSIILLRLAYAQMLSNDMAESIRVFQALAEFGEHSRGQFTTAVALSRLAMAFHVHGQRHEALTICRRAIDRFVNVHGQPLPVAGVMYIMAGQLAYAANDLLQAAQELEIGLDLVQRLGFAPAIAEGKEALARLQFAFGQPIEALATIAEARAVATQMHVRWYVDYLAAVEAEFQLKLGNGTAAEHWAETLDHEWSTVDLATDERALLCKPYARLLLTQQRPQEALNLLTCIARWEQMAGRRGHLVSTCILLALVHQALGDSEQAQASLERAVGLAACEEERRVFLDEGPSIIKLLPGVRRVAPIFVDSLLETLRFESSAGIHKQLRTHSAHPNVASMWQPGLIEPLSQRECEVLTLIAIGMPNDAVARALVIAPGTVKKHLDNIYGKLGTHNRTAAVARARQLDLLSG
jgi:LuxR family transcriptional regulator, maltose regulon positive regulatory protein